MAESNAGELDRAEEDADAVRAAAQSAKDRLNEAASVGVLGGVAFMRGHYERAVELYRSAARLNRDAPVHRAEDLCGVVISLAAADRWRPCVRAVQQLVTFAEQHNLRQTTWSSFLQAGRWFLDRGQPARYATLAVPALVFAFFHASQSNESDEGDWVPAPDWTHLMDAATTIAFHVKWSPSKDAANAWQEILDGMQLDQHARDIMRQVFDEAIRVASITDDADTPAVSEQKK